MSRQSLEKYQIMIYLAAIAAGFVFGTLLPELGNHMESLLWPTLGILLYATFTQVPLARLTSAMTDTKFLAAAVFGNFVLVPILVWPLSSLLPDDPAVRLGMLLVLLVPCTDWFITFTHLGGGDTKRAIAFSPISLLLQIILLPVYLWVFLGTEFVVSVAHQDMFFAFGGLIVLPLVLAYLTEKWVGARQDKQKVIDRLGWFPVPLLAVVVFIVATSQVALVTGSIALFSALAKVFVGYLIAAALLAWLLARLFHLSALEGRVLAFSLGSRNSFVVLPLALALPASFEVAVVVVVFQSLVELFGMLVYLWWVPKSLFPAQNVFAPID